MQNLHPLAAITLQSGQYLAITRGEQLFELRNGERTEKIEYPARQYVTIVSSDAYTTTPKTGPSGLVRRFL